MTRYTGVHRSQYDPGSSVRLRSMGCTPTSLANALRCATGGAINLSGEQVLAKVAPSEETNPLTPGWSLADASLAASRIPGAPPFASRMGPWSAVEAALRAGYGVVLQGDSDQFTGGCSGAFTGDHCVFVHPDSVAGFQRLGDPICPTWRTELLATLERYAEKLAGPSVLFGTFDVPVPPADTTPPDSSTEDPMAAVIVHALGRFAGRVTIGANVSAVLTDGSFLPLAEGSQYSAVLVGEIDWPVSGQVYGINPADTLYLVLAREVVAVPDPAPTAATLGTTTSADGQSVTVTIKGA